MSETVTMILSRDLRKNCHLASRIAVDIATHQPERDVWCIHTCGDQTIIEHSIVEAFEGVEPDLLLQQVEAPNLRVVSIPSGQWNALALMADIETNGRDAARPTIVLNSFEFAALTPTSRQKLVVDLIKLYREFNATIVLFSHELKKDLIPGYGGRGPLGYLAPYAGSIIRLSEPAIRQNPPKLAKNASVHEAQTKNTNRSGLERVIDNAMKNIYAHPNPLIGGRVSWEDLKAIAEDRLPWRN
jgi:hypothetical protein